MHSLDSHLNWLPLRHGFRNLGGTGMGEELGKVLSPGDNFEVAQSKQEDEHSEGNFWSRRNGYCGPLELAVLFW